LNLALSFFKRIVQSAETGGRVEKQIPNDVSELGTVITAISFHQKISFHFPSCVERLGFGRTTGRYVKELGFHTRYCVKQQLYSLEFGQYNCVEII
jgi:hypothetical protein